MRSLLRTVLLVIALSPTAQAQPPDSGESEPDGRPADDLIVVTGQAPEFRGRVDYYIIPYAKPPVGEYRWRPPQPIASDEDRMLRGGAEQNSCQQPDPPRLLGGPFTNYFLTRGGVSRVSVNRNVSEDCLMLWIASGQDNDARSPVMVWIHGDRLRYGSQYSVDLGRGEMMARSGVVFVSFNYRLGVFGFLAHRKLTAEAGISGNYGLMDAIAALQWIQTYIHQYGGDPTNVTLIGGQEGAQLTAALLASPEARGLFHRVILQSGSWMGTTIAPMLTLEEAEMIGERELDEYSDLSLEELRQIHPGDLQDLLPEPALVVDGRYVPRDLASIFARGEQSPVDVIVGSNQEEGITLLVDQMQIRTAEQYEAAIRRRLGTLADDYLAMYPSGTDDEARISFVMALSDELAWQMRLLARSQAAIGRKAYVYAFTRLPPRLTATSDVSAAVRRTEISYVFNRMNAPPPEFGGRIPISSGFPWSAGDALLGNVMSSYWVHFARDGQPGGTVLHDAGTVLPEWPEYGISAQSVESGVMEFGDRIGTDPRWHLTPEKIKLFDRIYAQLVPEAGW
jgi:para-nitrobenzyl esterase